MRTAFAGLTVIAAVLLTGAIGVSPAAAAPPGEIKLDVVTVNGSGCPAGTAQATMSPDNTGFHISYDKFKAIDSDAEPASAIRRFCQIGVLVHVPQGFTFAVASADYRGRAVIARGVTATQKNKYYFQAEADALDIEHTFTGAFNGVWRSRDVAPIIEYSPCGQDVIFNMKSQLLVTSNLSTSSGSYITLSGSRAEVDTLVQFGWKAC